MAQAAHCGSPRCEPGARVSLRNKVLEGWLGSACQIWCLLWLWREEKKTRIMARNLRKSDLPTFSNRCTSAAVPPDVTHRHRSTGLVQLQSNLLQRSVAFLSQIKKSDISQPNYNGISTRWRWTDLQRERMTERHPPQIHKEQRQRPIHEPLRPQLSLPVRISQSLSRWPVGRAAWRNGEAPQVAGRRVWWADGPSARGAAPRARGCVLGL